MTMGIVSQLDRLVPSISTSRSRGIFAQPDVIQTDAAVNPGNSGGPLLNVNGQVVGITFLRLSNATGLNFAIPSNLILRIVPALIQTGHYDHPWLGFRGDSLTPIDAENMGLPRNFKGVIVLSVIEGGPLSKAGIKPQDTGPGGYKGDIIVAADGHRIKSLEDLLVYLEEQKSPDQNIILTIDRNGQEMNVNTTLQARPHI
jgi:S1-C subfamily serine protease